MRIYSTDTSQSDRCANHMCVCVCVLCSPHRALRLAQTPHRTCTITRVASPRLASRHVTSELRGRTRPPPMRALHPRCRQVGGESYSEPELDSRLKQRSSRAGCVQSADARRDRRLAALAAHRGRRGPRGGLRCTSRRLGRDPAVPDGHEGGAPSECGEESKSSGGRHGVAAAARLRRVKRALGVAAVIYDVPRLSEYLYISIDNHVNI